MPNGNARHTSLPRRSRGEPALTGAADAVRMQEEVVGLRSVTDGEFRRVSRWGARRNERRVHPRSRLPHGRRATLEASCSSEESAHSWISAPSRPSTPAPKVRRPRPRTPLRGRLTPAIAPPRRPRSRRPCGRRRPRRSRSTTDPSRARRGGRTTCAGTRRTRCALRGVSVTGSFATSTRSKRGTDESPCSPSTHASTTPRSTRRAFAIPVRSRRLSLSVYPSTRRR